MGHRLIAIREAVRRGLVLTTLFCCGWGTARFLPPERFGFGSRTDRETAVLGEAWRLIEKNYVDYGTIEPDRLKRAALTAMLAALGDKGHTGLIPAEQLGPMQKSMRGQADHSSGANSSSVCWARVPGEPIAQLVIRIFGTRTDEELKQALQEMRGQGIHGLIVDLRGCPGGWRDQCIAVASEFLTSGNVMLERDAAGQLTPVPVRPNGAARDLPLCVLMNADTASCAEILAAALQDDGRGTLIGTQTFGAGTLLQRFPLSDGSALMLAVAEWRTPNGRHVWHKGLTPDIAVELPPGARRLTTDAVAAMNADSLAASADTQFLTGLDVLRCEMSR